MHYEPAEHRVPRGEQETIAPTQAVRSLTLKTGSKEPSIGFEDDSICHRLIYQSQLLISSRN